MKTRDKLANIANTTNNIKMAHNLTTIIEGLDKQKWEEARNNKYYAIFKKTELIATLPLTIDKVNIMEARGYHVRKL